MIISIIIPDYLKNELVKTYTEKPISLNEISVKFGLSLPTVSKILKQYNIPIYSKNQLYDQSLNEKYFSSIDTEEKAYFLGLFLADGCVYFSNDFSAPRIILGLKNEDEYMIQKYHKSINSSNKLRYDSRDGFVSSVVSSKHMADDLSFYGVCGIKTLRTIPFINFNLLNHLIRGLFDGDGSFGFRLSHLEMDNNHYRGRVNIVGYDSVIFDLEYIFINIIGISYCQIGVAKSNVGLKYINIERKEDIYKFYNFIYNNSAVYLERKKFLFEQFFRLVIR